MNPSSFHSIRRGAAGGFEVVDQSGRVLQWIPGPGSFPSAKAVTPAMNKTKAPKPQTNSQDKDELIGVRIDKAEEWLRSVFKTIRFNRLTRLIELDGEPQSGADFDVIHARLAERTGRRISGELCRKMLISIGRRNTYCPFVEWLQGIEQEEVLKEEEWNDLSLHLLGYSDEWATTKLQRQLVGTVKRALEPGYQHDTTLLLVSGQGYGKDTLLRSLFPDDWYYGNASYRAGDKDCVLGMYSAIAVSFTEMERVFGRGDQAGLKSFLTDTEDRLREPYGRATERQLRHFTFWASTNDPHLLRDGSGNRRFPWVRFEQHDAEWLRRNRKRLFARILQVGRTTFPTFYNRDEIQILNEEAQLLAPPNELRADLYEGLRSGAYSQTSVWHAWTSVCGRAAEGFCAGEKQMLRELDLCTLTTRAGKRSRSLAQGTLAAQSGNPVAIWDVSPSVSCAGVTS